MSISISQEPDSHVFSLSQIPQISPNFFSQMTALRPQHQCWTCSSSLSNPALSELNQLLVKELSTNIEHYFLLGSGQQNLWMNVKKKKRLHHIFWLKFFWNAGIFSYENRKVSRISMQNLSLQLLVISVGGIKRKYSLPPKIKLLICMDVRVMAVLW